MIAFPQEKIKSIQKIFEENFAIRGELGASLSIWQGGEELISLAQGYCEREKTTPWTSETLVPFWSVTKGLASAAVLLCLEENARKIEEPVASIWPELQNKELTFAQLLSHQGGLAALDEPVSLFDYEKVIGALEKQTPNWPLGNQHGYHPRTFGFLAEEIIRRLTHGVTLSDYFRKKIAEPLQLDLWIGLPQSEHHRVATVYPGKNTPRSAEKEFYQAFLQKATLTYRAFHSPQGTLAIADFNRPENWERQFPAWGGIGTARSLGKFYSALAHQKNEGEKSLFSSQLLAWMQIPQIIGENLTLLMPTAFSAGFMKDPIDANGNKITQLFGSSLSAFGHPGAGGSHAFADPENGLSFAYTMNQMELGVLPNEKSLLILKEIYDL